MGAKVGLLRAIEIVSGASADMELRGKNKCYNRLAAALTRDAFARGNRGILVPMPPSWPDDGLANVVGYNHKIPGAVDIAQRFTEELVTVQKDSVPPHTNVGQLFVDFNWSEERLSLSSSAPDAKGKSHALKNYFSKHVVPSDEGVDAGAVSNRMLQNMRKAASSPAAKKQNQDDADSGCRKLEPELLARPPPLNQEPLLRADTSVKQEPSGEEDVAKPCQVEPKEEAKLNLDESTLAAPDPDP